MVEVAFKSGETRPQVWFVGSQMDALAFIVKAAKRIMPGGSLEIRIPEVYCV
jgi:hypothetical protein